MGNYLGNMCAEIKISQQTRIAVREALKSKRIRNRVVLLQYGES